LVPTHYGLLGDADSWGPKETVWLVPVLSVFLFATLGYAGREPRTARYPHVKELQLLIAWYKLEMSVLFTWIQVATVNVALKESSGLGVYFLPMFLVVLLVPLAVFHLSGYRMPAKHG
jgi:hypothetical protein